MAKSDNSRDIAMVNDLRNKTSAGALRWEEVEGVQNKTLVASFTRPAGSDNVYKLTLRENRFGPMKDWSLLMELSKKSLLEELLLTGPNSDSILNHALEDLARVVVATAI